MSKEQKKKDPLLFIQQSPFKPLKGNMQETFSLKQAMKNDSKPSGEKMPAEGGEKKRRSKGSFEQEEEAIFGAPSHDEVGLSAKEVQQTIEGYERKAKGHEHGFSFQRLKPFKEMDVEEKLDYLANFPRQLPPVPCLFQTEGKAVRGILKEKNNREVIVKLFDQTESTILIKDLVEVRMVGL